MAAGLYPNCLLLLIAFIFEFCLFSRLSQIAFSWLPTWKCLNWAAAKAARILFRPKTTPRRSSSRSRKRNTKTPSQRPRLPNSKLRWEQPRHASCSLFVYSQNAYLSSDRCLSEMLTDGCTDIRTYGRTDLRTDG